MAQELDLAIGRQARTHESVEGFEDFFGVLLADETERTHESREGPRQLPS